MNSKATMRFGCLLAVVAAAAAAVPDVRSQPSNGHRLRLLAGHLGDQEGAHLLHQRRGGGVVEQSQGSVCRKDPLLTFPTPAVGSKQSHGPAVGTDRFRHTPFPLDQGCLTARAALVDRVGFGLHRPFHNLALDFQRALPDLLLDKAQALFGMLLHPIQSSLQVLSPLGQILRQDRRFLFCGDLLD
ncbi:MAG: hypothetical protein AB9869_22395 [Verrucomicrobiia bacterium]